MSFRFLCSLTVYEVLDLCYDFREIKSYSTRRRISKRLVRSYHITSPGAMDGEKALHELMLRLLYELFNGYISGNDLLYGTWERSTHRDRKHNEWVARLMGEVVRCPRTYRLLRCIRWLN